MSKSFLPMVSQYVVVKIQDEKMLIANTLITEEIWQFQRMLYMEYNETGREYEVSVILDTQNGLRYKIESKNPFGTEQTIVFPLDPMLLQFFLDSNIMLLAVDMPPEEFNARVDTPGISPKRFVEGYKHRTILMSQGFNEIYKSLLKKIKSEQSY
jgi:hypothetical protein